MNIKHQWCTHRLPSHQQISHTGAQAGQPWCKRQNSGSTSSSCTRALTCSSASHCVHPRLLGVWSTEATFELAQTTPLSTHLLRHHRHARACSNAAHSTRSTSSMAAPLPTSSARAALGLPQMCHTQSSPEASLSCSSVVTGILGPAWKQRPPTH